MKRKLKYILLALCVSFMLLPKAVNAVNATTISFKESNSQTSLAYNNGSYAATNGKVAVSIDSAAKSDASADFNVSGQLDKDVVIALTADTGYAGTLKFNGQDVNSQYLSKTGLTSTYAFKLSQLGMTDDGALHNFEVSFAKQTASFNITLNGTNNSLTGTNGDFTVDNGSLTVSISGTKQVAATADYQNVALDAPIVITMTAATNYAGSLGFNGSAVDSKYLTTNGLVSTYSFTLADLGMNAGDGKGFSVSFTENSQPPVPPNPPIQQDVPIPADSILLNISDFLGNSLSYDQAHADTLFGMPGIKLGLSYSYDGTTWNDFSNFAADTDVTQAYESKSYTYTYAFSNHSAVYLKETNVASDGKMQSKALEPQTDGTYSWAGDVVLNKVYTLNTKNVSYDLTFANGISTIIWSYTTKDASMKVENGTVKITNVKDTSGTDITASLQDTANGIGNTDDGGYWLIHEGYEVTIEIVPNYGYQFLGGGFNDSDGIKGDTAVSSFTFTMPSRPIHLHAVFQKVDNTVTNTSKKVASGDIAIADTEISSGNVDLSVADITLDAAQISNFETAASSYDISSYLNISLDQVINKGTTDAAWTNQLKELKNPATVTLKLDEGVNGNEIVIVHEKHDGTFEIIPTTYDAAAQTISFTTTSFSNYAIASRTVDDTYKAPDTAVRDHTGAWMFGLLASISFAGCMFGLRRKFSTK
jgi:hypothetical protein